MSTIALLAIAAGGIGLLLLLIIRFKVHAFLALLIVSVLVGLAAGLPLATIPATDDQPEQLGIIPAIIAGMGGTLGSVAILVALGAMLGKIIELSGGAESLAGRKAQGFDPGQFDDVEEETDEEATDEEATDEGASDEEEVK